jgi:hypothetical protein
VVGLVERIADRQGGDQEQPAQEKDGGQERDGRTAPPLRGGKALRFDPRSGFVCADSGDATTAALPGARDAKKRPRGRISGAPRAVSIELPRKSAKGSSRWIGPPLAAAGGSRHGDQKTFGDLADGMNVEVDGMRQADGSILAAKVSIEGSGD